MRSLLLWLGVSRTALDAIKMGLNSFVVEDASRSLLQVSILLSKVKVIF
jgi:hypothetical protein